MIRFLVFLARLCGKLIGICARTQTRLLTKAESLGWIPTPEEAARLVIRQTQLGEWALARKLRKAVKAR